jgi:hypothetical protein
MVAPGGLPQSTEPARLRTWVEKRTRELLRTYDREGEPYTLAEHPDAIRLYAWLPKARRRIEGPAVPYEWIEIDDGRRALMAITTFVLRLPKHTEDAADAPPATAAD